MGNILAKLRGGSGTLGAAALIVILLVAGFYIQQGRNAGQAADQVTAVLAQPGTTDAPAATPVVPRDAPAALDQTETPDSTPATPLQAPEVMTAAPAFDEVRREPDGMTVIAGRGAPGAVVSVLKDGVQIASSTVDRSGKFATIALIPPDGRGHSLTLSQLVGETAQASEDEILLAPVTVPVTAPVTATVAEIASEPATDAGTNTAALTPSEALTPGDAVAPALAGDLASLSGPAPLVQDEVATVGAVPPLTGSSTPVAQTVASLAPDAATPQKPSAPAVLKSTAEGVELLNPETPEVMDNVALDTISYSNAGEVQLAGRAQSDATSVRVYLNNTARVDLPVDAAGRWRGDVPDVDEGIYTLRVDEVSADGKVSSRVETPFKREALEVLAAAAAAQDGPLKAITVQKGATLWAIARERYGEGELYVKVFEANKEAIRDPDLIYPGQIFALPQE